MKKPLLTIVGALMLLQAPFAIGEETVTISVKDLNALKSLCSSIEGATGTTASAPPPAIKPSVAAVSGASAPAIGNAVKIASLRGFHELDKEAKPVEKKKQFKISGGIKKTWELQPPSIPHGIEKDRITLNGNTCMKCHSKANHEKEKAPQTPESHYKARDGKTLDKLSTRRWFCVQCHTPQADVKPLVDNTF